MRFFDTKNEVQRKIFINTSSLIIAILFFLIFTRINDIGSFLSKAVHILLPFILGFGIAFILNRPIMAIEKWIKQWKNLKPRTIRFLSTAIVFLLFILFILFAFWVVVPSLLDSLKGFSNNLSSYVSSFESFINQASQKFSIDADKLWYSLQTMDVATAISDFMKNYLSSFMKYSISLFKGAFNIIIALAAAFYMMMDKENLLHGIKKLAHSILPEAQFLFLSIYSHDARIIFNQYIIGNLIDSLIIGVACWLGMVIFQIPYAPMIGFIIGLTNIIPVFGPFLGAIPVIGLLLLIDPMKAFIFAIFILVLQQVDGNILKPIILGDKLGISGFWILFSVTVGGAIGGVAGMFLGVPIFALIYKAIDDFSQMRIERKEKYTSALLNE